MLSLILCEDTECSVPITPVTKHKIYSTFCKPCGRKQRTAKTPGNGKVRNRTTPGGHKLVMNDHDVFVCETNSDWVVLKENGRFSLYVRGIKMLNQTYLTDCLGVLDSKINNTDEFFDGSYQMRRSEKAGIIARDWVGPWVEFSILGTRADQPFKKENLSKDVGQLLTRAQGGKSNTGYTLEQCVEFVHGQGWMPYL